MNCPACRDSSLVHISIEGVTLDHCNKCGGHWLDQGELALLAKTDMLRDPEPVKSQAGDRYCPHDSERMNEVEFVQQDGLKVDICPQCRGIWMDATELSTALSMLERHAQLPINKPTPRALFGLLANWTKPRAVSK